MKYKRIGFDLDHTLIDYSGAISSLAKQYGFEAKSKEDAKRYYQESELGDLGWQEFQSVLYTEGLEFANVAIGAKSLLSRAAAHGAEIFVVSHKTEFANQGNRRVSLRAASNDFLESNGLSPGIFAAENVFYAENRSLKISKVRELSLDLFVDDLPEVLEEPGFPGNTLKVIYDPAGAHMDLTFVRVSELSELEVLLFDS